MVQKLETEQQASKQRIEETRTERLRETENFFTMVKRFFTEHEALKEYAQNCLRDLHQLQQYFQVRFFFQEILFVFTKITFPNLPKLLLK